MNRKERRAAAHIQRKLDRKAGFPSPDPGPQPPIAKNEIPNPASINPKPPSRPPISAARLNANRANAQFSTGPSPAGRAASSQNHTIHGLARHNGTFKLLATEDAAGFEALKQALAEEHQPSTPTEAILVNQMAECQWLADRALNLHATCFDSQSGQVADPKLFSLYLRYHTTHQRAFYKALNQLVKLRSERRKDQAGFEAQKRKEARTEMDNFHSEMQKEMKADENFIDNPELRDLAIRMGVAMTHKSPNLEALKNEFKEKCRSVWQATHAAAA